MSDYKIIRLKCTEFDFRWGSAPDPLGEFTVLKGFKGPASKGREGWEKKGKTRGKGGKGRGQAPKYFGLEPALDVLPS